VEADRKIIRLGNRVGKFLHILDAEGKTGHLEAEIGLRENIFQRALKILCLPDFPHQFQEENGALLFKKVVSLLRQFHR